MKAAAATTVTFTLILSLFFAAPSIVASSSILNNPYLGISPQDESYFKVSSDTIKCRNGSGKFKKSQLNDDFCDCLDGTDEPGTSACPEGRFYCRNAGHTPLVIFSSRVNDGICDCCDGSDEYNGQVKCRNTCWEAGKVARDKLKKKVATYKEGVSLRKQAIEQAKIAIEKEEAELSKLKNEEKILKGLVQQLKERKEEIEKAEEKEHLRKEKEEKERREAEEKANREQGQGQEDTKQEKDHAEGKADHEVSLDTNVHDQIGIDYATEQDVTEELIAQDTKTEYAEPSIAKVPLSKAESHEAKETEGSLPQENKVDTTDGSETSDDAEKDASENTEELSREELGRLVASRWTGNSEKQSEGADTSLENEHEDHDDRTDAVDPHDEEDGYPSETDDETEKYDDSDTGKYEDGDIEDDLDEKYEENVHEDASSYNPDSDYGIDSPDTGLSSNPSWLEKIQQSVKKLLQTINIFKAPVDISEGDRVRKEYEESRSKLSKIESRISSLTQKLKHDFGAEKEFYSLYGNCFESKQNKYVYKICPFKRASQVEGHSTTRLGEWDKFEDSYRLMVFSSGDNCWNGPDRSLKVRLRCGLSSEVADVDEPSRCEYVALFSTPALCTENKLEELENKLEQMNKEQPQNHDEL